MRQPFKYTSRERRSECAWGESTRKNPFDRDAGFTASYMETLLMGPERIEVLSTRPRTLQVLPG